MSQTLSPFDAAVAELVAAGWTREVAESRVRAQLPHLAPPKVEELGPDALEDEHVANGDDLMLALGFDVVKFSQKRRVKEVTPGVPDRRYYHRRRRLFCWWEAKASWGRQRPEQRAYQEMCAASGDPYVLGGLDALKAWLVGVDVVEGFDNRGMPIPTPITQEIHSNAS